MKRTFTCSYPAAIYILIAFLLAPAILLAQGNTCGTAALLSSGTTCSPTGGTVTGSDYGGDLPVTCGTPRYDVWYKFVAQTTNPTITMGAIGANFTNPKLQLLSGSCGSFTHVACSILSGSNQVIACSGLTAGATYYIRVFSTAISGSAPSSAGGFAICITDIPASKIETSRSYINVTKGSTGGTVDYLDTLEIRSTFVIKNNSADSLAFLDTLYNGRGFRLVPGSIALRTNEGKIYKSFTDLYDADAGHRYQSGLDTVIRINFGTGATTTAKGKLLNTSKPSFYGSSCIMMATYRVVVYATYGTKINFKTGAITYRDVATGVMYNGVFADDSLIVYSSPGLCPNAVSTTNAIGVEANGTFGTPSATPLARNRGASAFTTYSYWPFNAAGGPQDYYYAVANNTSTTFTTLNNWFKPNNTYRVFGLWDIIGDHTGAANPVTGNPACDTTKPVSATNPCGYMLVINSAYKTDTAFQYTMTNLCPGTFYELSGWFRNICYRCGCDSNGTGSAGAGYIPFATGDSSGVQPNIAFDVNGVDYYTTGNLPYYGVTPGGSDSTNKWVKKGFIYVTGPTETSFTLTIRNNAPGGGGNDWALDDLNVSTCLPNMKYSPSNNPTLCYGNTITISDTVRSYFNSYKNYKWQRSTDGGVTWTDIVGSTGVGSPVWNGSAWQYTTAYTILPAQTTLANNGDKYRVVVGTTAANLLNTNCNFTDGIAIITLNIINCAPILEVKLLSFTGKEAGRHATLSWSTSQETEAVSFELERSSDGNNYGKIAAIDGAGHPPAAVNQYRFADSSTITGPAFYRLALITTGGRRTVSHTVQFQSAPGEFSLTNVVNPFLHSLTFDVTVNEASQLDVVLLDGAGQQVKMQSSLVRSSVTNIIVDDLENLSAGIYILQVRYRGKTLTRKVVKK